MSGARALDESAGVQNEDAAGRERDVGCLVFGVRIDARQQPWRDAEGVRPTVGAAEQSGRVSGCGQACVVVVQRSRI